MVLNHKNRKTQELKEARIIKECQNNHPDAQRALYELYMPYVLAMVRRFGILNQDVEDVIQEIFIEVFVNINKYDAQKGDILRDGKSIKEYNIQNLRSCLAIVLQDVFLFGGSVLENITLRDDTITREQVIEASKMIGAHEFIEKLPGGYDYEVMERGATLSMGQRQLISFVRALVFDPDILILDEATSSIDPETESIIQYAIEKLIAKRTSIIIAHRLSTIRHASNIMVLEKGELQEFGSHQELLKIENGHYRELHEMQFLEMAE